MKNVLKIEIGAGEDPYKPDEFEHCDVRKLPHIEHVCSAEKPPFKWNSIYEIFARDVLEHLPRKSIPIALKRWHNILVPGGKVDIVVPNLDFFLKEAYKHVVVSDEPKLSWDKILKAVYGGQRYDEDFHCWGFTEESLRQLLQSIGFVSIVRGQPSEVNRSDIYSLRIIAFKKVKHD